MPGRTTDRRYNTKAIKYRPKPTRYNIDFCDKPMLKTSTERVWLDELSSNPVVCILTRETNKMFSE
jgi:hypothetical protein